MDKNQEKSILGVKTVCEYLMSEGFVCEDVSRNRKEKGCDIIAVKNNKILRIEVKCSGVEKGIPDCFGTEFNDKLEVVPDYFYIVRINELSKPFRIDILTKEEMNKYSNLHKEKRIIKIANKLKTDLHKGLIGKNISIF